MKSAIFLDRDGVINTDVSDLVHPDQFVMLANVPQAIKAINDKGFLAVVATNQPIIAKGFCTFEGLDKIHAKMAGLLEEHEAHIDNIYVCPHHPKSGFPGEVTALKFDCDCRKPKPGLILQAMRDLDIDPKSSWMIGNSEVDILAGKSAGVRTVFIDDGTKPRAGSDLVASNLLDAVQKIFGT